MQQDNATLPNRVLLNQALCDAMLQPGETVARYELRFFADGTAQMVRRSSCSNPAQDAPPMVWHDEVIFTVSYEEAKALSFAPQPWRHVQGWDWMLGIIDQHRQQAWERGSYELRARAVEIYEQHGFRKLGRLDNSDIVMVFGESGSIVVVDAQGQMHEQMVYWLQRKGIGGA